MVTFSKEVHHIDTIQDQTLSHRVFQEYADLFIDEVGNLPVTYSMKIDPAVTPVVNPLRGVPAAKQKRVEQELKRMQALGVIEPVDEPTEWVSNMVATHKRETDDVRICIDPRNLNKSLMRRHHPMHTVEVAAQMSGATVFSVLDAKISFWQIKLDDASSFHTTFATPLGRFKFLRMHCGINTASEVFQRAMEQIFAGYPCAIIVDDVIIDYIDQDRPPAFGHNPRQAFPYNSGLPATHDVEAIEVQPDLDLQKGETPIWQTPSHVHQGTMYAHRKRNRAGLR